MDEDIACQKKTSPKYCQDCLNQVIDILSLNVEDEPISSFWICLKCSRSFGIKMDKIKICH